MGGPKFFFALSRRKIRSFLPSLGVFSLNFGGVFEAPEMSGPWCFKHHQNSMEGPQRERRKERICGGRRKKKREILGPHPLPPFKGTPTLQDPSGPHPSRPPPQKNVPSPPTHDKKKQKINFKKPNQSTPKNPKSLQNWFGQSRFGVFPRCLDIVWSTR